MSGKTKTPTRGSGSKGSGSRGAGRGTGAGGRTTTRRRQPRPPRPAGEPLLGERVRDVWGVGLVVLAVLSALGLYSTGAAGTVGLWLKLLLRGLFGTIGLLAPPALLGAGVILLGQPRPANRRLVIGVGLMLSAVTGLWHLLRGAPSMAAPVPALHDAGGWAGAVLAGPLLGVAAGPGATVVLVGVLAAGAMMVTATAPRTLVARGTAAARTGYQRLRKRARQAARLDEQAMGEAAASTGAPAAAPEEGPAPAEPPDPEPTDEPARPAPAKSRPAPKTAVKLAPADGSSYQIPSLSLLRTGRAAPGNKRALDQMTRALEKTLAQFGVDAKVIRVARGPTVTRFEVAVGEGVKVAAVTRLSDDIAYALATSEIRMVAPIPGKSAIGVEVPNRERDHVTLGDVLRSPEAAVQQHPLAAGIGVDIAGNPVMVNLATMPHLLIAGATGSGKSVTINSIVTSVIARSTPAQAKLILIDPKRVELNYYEGTPHLLTPVVTDPKRATEALAWTVKEMEQRYERLALLGYRNIDTYNAAVRDKSVRQASAVSGKADAAGEGGARAAGGRGSDWAELPYILLVIDELADLMMVAPRDVEGAIVRIAQMARAVGIHLIVATQRPSVDVVTGLIKANIPSRLALAMATMADSRTILDSGGAEKLVGHGDMLFLPANAGKPHRIQGCYIDESEVEQVVDWCKAQRHADYHSGVVREGSEALKADLTSDDATDEDLTRAAMELVVRSGLGSTSMLQRKLKVGFARAGRIMDELETMGVVGPSEGSKSRHVLMTVEELEQRGGP